MNSEIEQLLNAQIEKEEYSAHLYLAMASWADHSGYEGTAKWLYIQAEEERMHMLKFVKYINERGGKSIISAIKAPPSEYKSVKNLFEAVLAHEQGITNAINEIVAACTQHKDFTTQNWLQWFVNEQIEEERNARQIIDKLKLVGDGSLYLFDRDIMSLRSDNASAESASEKAN
jgi:ferritin